MICLQNLCINLIAKEFEKFYFAFSVSNNKELQRKFEFLQIKYSSELGSELYNRQKLKKEYLRFIINKYLKFFNEYWIYEIPSYRYDREDIFRRLPNLTEIFCSPITDESLKLVAKFCPRIVEIDGISIITDKGVMYLCKKKNGSVPCPDLKKLPTRNSAVTDEGLGHLLRNLKSLELEDVRIPSVLYSLHKNDLPKLENVPIYNLVELVMFYEREKPYYNDLLKICLTVCPKLRSLTSVVIKDKEQLNYFNHTGLEKLDISFRELKEKINIDSFLKKCGRNLLSLSIKHCILSISQLEVSYPKLRDLSINDVSFTDDHGHSKTVFHSLVTCRFHDFEMNNENIKAMNFLLFSSPNLRNIIFVNCDLCPDLKIIILKCCETLPLEVVEFFRTPIVELSFAKDILIRCPTLKFFGVRDCHYSVEEREELTQFIESLSNRPCLHILPLYT